MTLTHRMEMIHQKKRDALFIALCIGLIMVMFVLVPGTI